jgi:hypothetical protein
VRRGGEVLEIRLADHPATNNTHANWFQRRLLSYTAVRLMAANKRVVPASF